MFNPRARAGTAASQRSLLSVNLNPNVVEDVRVSVDPKQARTGQILSRAATDKRINVDDVFALLDQKPLSPEEKTSGRRIMKVIEKTFMFQLENMI